jgi:hypothetical protein
MRAIFKDQGWKQKFVEDAIVAGKVLETGENARAAEERRPPQSPCRVAPT